MEKLELLAQRIDSLIQELDRLREENHQLREEGKRLREDLELGQMASEELQEQLNRERSVRDEACNRACRRTAAERLMAGGRHAQLSS